MHQYPLRLRKLLVVGWAVVALLAYIFSIWKMAAFFPEGNWITLLLSTATVTCYIKPPQLEVNERQSFTVGRAGSFSPCWEHYRSLGSERGLLEENALIDIVFMIQISNKTPSFITSEQRFILHSILLPCGLQRQMFGGPGFCSFLEIANWDKWKEMLILEQQEQVECLNLSEQDRRQRQEGCHEKMWEW